MRIAAMILLIVVQATALATASTDATTKSSAPLRQTDAGAATPRASATRFDYVIIVGTNDLVARVNALETWKEQIGFSVAVVTMPQIQSLYPTGDDADKIWSFLHDRYGPNDWAIRYVLLVGDIDTIPIRLLYENDVRPAYGSDYYYANLDPVDWDLDRDDRWGEFVDDALDVDHEVVVGRIPTNDVVEVQTICQHIVDYEQDTGAWKQSALLAHGIMDYEGLGTKSDQAVLADLLIRDFFEPLAWQTHTLYEQNGIDPSFYAPDDPLSQANYQNDCGQQQQGVISCNAHGNVGEFGSYVWVGDFDNDGLWDHEANSPEMATTSYSLGNGIPMSPPSAITMLTGCNTGAIIGDDPGFSSSVLRSRYLIRIPRDDTLAELYLLNGAPASIGPTAGGDYSKSHWTGPEHKSWNTLSYLFFEHLLDEDARAGDAFYQAQTDYAALHGLARGIRDFNYFGDPSIRLKGVLNRPGGMDREVYEGPYHDYAADCDDNGDMYVGVIATDQNTAPGEIHVLKSVDNGENWYPWTVVSTAEAVWDHDLLVSRYDDGVLLDQRLHVIYTTDAGLVYDVRLQLADPSNFDTTVLPSDGRWATNLSVARDPVSMPAVNTIYAAWQYDQMNANMVRLAISANNGATWVDTYEEVDRTMPDVDAGPFGRLYLAMLTDPFVTDSDVMLVQSNDFGQHFGAEVNLTSADGAQVHYHPAVAATTHNSIHTVWVVYDHQVQDPKWGLETDLRGAYSPDAGGTWIKDRIVSADVGVDEGQPDIRGYRSAPNQYLNIVYNYDRYPNPGYRRNIVWRYLRGSTPRNWSFHRVENDYPAAAPQPMRPRIVYAPGAGPGSGIVYGGPNNATVYFSAPWLTSTPKARPVEATPVALASPTEVESYEVESYVDAPSNTGTATDVPVSLPAVAKVTAPLVWDETGDLDGAFALSSIRTNSLGQLFATGSASTGEGNEGVIYWSAEQGSSWQRLANPPGAWSISCLLESSPDVFVAGGFRVYEPTVWAGMIYRSQNGGASWEPRFERSMGVVTEIIEAADGTLWAATGWSGEIYRSFDDGLSWVPVIDLGGGVVIHDIIQSDLNEFFVALEGAAAPSPIMKSPNGYEWFSMGGLGAVTAAYEIVERGPELLAAVTASGHGAVYSTPVFGAGWDALSPIPEPDVVAIRSLAVGPGGVLLAGAERTLGPSDTYVFAQLPGRDSWTIFGGSIDLASSVYSLVTTGSDVFAATGFVYGNVYRCSFDALTAVDPGGSAPPRSFEVQSSYPNPFNPQTTIPYYLPASTRVTVVVYDVSGRAIRTLEADGLESQGWHRVAWDGTDESGRDVASGVYYYRLAAGPDVRSGKLVLVR